MYCVVYFFFYLVFIFYIWKHKFTFLFTYSLTQVLLGKVWLTSWECRPRRCIVALKLVIAWMRSPQLQIILKLTRKYNLDELNAVIFTLIKYNLGFSPNSPFIYGDHLVCLDSGLVDENKLVKCDRSEESVALIQKDLDGKNFDSCSFKRKDKISNLQSLYSYVIIKKEDVTIDPLTLFPRLALVVEKKPEAEMENYFYC